MRGCTGCLAFLFFAYNKTFISRRETGLSSPVKYFYCPFQGVTSFVDHSCYFCIVCYAFVRVCLLMPCGHLLGKGRPLGSRLWCLIVSLLLSHWYLGSSVVLDCIDSWSLPSFLLSYISIPVTVLLYCQLQTKDQPLPFTEVSFYLPHSTTTYTYIGPNLA